VAHALKGAVSHLAAPAVFEAALRLEEIGQDGNLNGADAAWAALADSLGRLQPALAALGPPATGGG
jgi:hypothetical protein